MILKMCIKYHGNIYIESWQYQQIVDTLGKDGDWTIRSGEGIIAALELIQQLKPKELTVDIPPAVRTPLNLHQLLRKVAHCKMSLFILKLWNAYLNYQNSDNIITEIGHGGWVLINNIMSCFVYFNNLFALCYIDTVQWTNSY